MKKWPLATLLLLLIFSSLLSLSLSRDTLTKDSPLKYNDTLESHDGAFTLGIFSPGPANSNRWYLGIWYTDTVETIVWVANRDNPMPDTNGVLFIDGSSSNLQLKTNASKVFWSTSPSSMVNPIAQLLDEGNFVLREESTNKTTWQSFDYPTDTLLPGMRFGWIGGRNHYLTSWTGSNNPASSNYKIELVRSDWPEILISRGLELLFRTGPLIGGKFSGAPKLEEDVDITFNYVLNGTETYIYMDSSSKSRLVLNNSILQRYVLVGVSAWRLHWSVPSDPCDNYTVCGQQAVCKLNSSNQPNCTCLNKFKPNCELEWEEGETSYGCRANVNLSYTENDGFLSISNVKLPDTTNVTVDRTIGLKECKKRCLMNPSCTACSNLNGNSGCAMWMDNFTDIRQFNDGGLTLYYRVAGSEVPG